MFSENGGTLYKKTVLVMCGSLNMLNENAKKEELMLKARK